MVEHQADSPAKRIYSAPRRFDLSTILVVTTAFALLFGFFRWLELHNGFVIYVAVTMVCVGVSQALFFGGKKPRTASMITGVFCNVGFLILFVVEQAEPRSALFAWLLNSALISGPITGYFAGTLVGSVFLVSDKLRRILGRQTEKS